MSWLKALQGAYHETAARASQGRVPLSTAAVFRRLARGANMEALQQNIFELPEVGPSTAALHHVSGSWASALDVIRFSQTASHGNVKWPMERLSLPLAAQCVAILLEAGKSATAVELLRSWRLPSVRVRLHSRISATVQLKKAIKTLGVIGDVETLRVIVSVLHQALTEQRQRRRAFVIFPPSSGIAANAVVASDDGDAAAAAAQTGAEENYRLLSALGMQRTRVLLVNAVHELLTQDECIVPLFEKLTWINATAIATSPMPSPGTHVPYIIPYELQEDFGNVIEHSVSYDEHLLQQVGPALTSGFLHPTQSELVELLCAPRSEMQRVYKKGLLRLPSEAWMEMGRLALPHSPFLQKARQMEVLLEILCGPDAARVVAPSWRCLRRKYASKTTEEQLLLRQHIVTHLRSPRSVTRRLWSRALLRHPRLLCQLGLSPLMVFRACALTFRSFRVHKPFSRLCIPLLRWARRMGRIEDAARLVWNHLSVNDPALAALFSRHPLALDDAAIVVCRAMRRALGMQRREAWMGHRSLAVLRIAANSGLLTPAHCIPICSAALDCGVHFATVEEFAGEVFGEGSEMARWVLNMVRLMADSHTVHFFLPLESPAHSVSIRSLLQRYVYQTPVVGSPPSVKVCLPSRSKMLALWAIVNDDVMNDALRRLVCRLFLDGDVQDALNGMSEGGPPTVQQVVDGFFREEVFASIAANCTKERSYYISMNVLLSRRRTRNAHRCMLLMLSEMNDESVQGASPCMVSDV